MRRGNTKNPRHADNTGGRANKINELHNNKKNSEESCVQAIFFMTTVVLCIERKITDPIEKSSGIRKRFVTSNDGSNVALVEFE